MSTSYPVKVCDRLWLLGREESCVYLLQGESEAMIISGGYSYILPDVLAQLETIAPDPERITGLLILHSHFDHSGIVPGLNCRRP